MEFIKDILVPLLSAIVGGGFTLLGAYVTFKHEEKEKKQRDVERAKPIVINYMAHEIADKNHTPKYIFEPSEDFEKSGIHFTGVMKNTDNGILFLDKFVSGGIEYNSIGSNAVDKSMAFYLIINNIPNKREELTDAKLYVHDVYGNRYFYPIKYNFDSNRQSELEIGNINTVRTDRR